MKLSNCIGFSSILFLLGMMMYKSRYNLIMSEKFAIGKSEFFVGMDLTNGLNPLKCKPILFGFLTFLLNYAKVQKKVVNVQKKVVNDQKSFMNDQKRVVNDQKRVVNDQKRVVNDQKEVLKTRLYRLIISKLN